METTNILIEALAIDVDLSVGDCGKSQDDEIDIHQSMAHTRGGSSMMAPLASREILEAFREALRQWSYDGYVVWLRRPGEWLRKNFDHEDMRTVSRMMHEHVEAGREIDQVVERRELWRDQHEFHYDFRISIAGRRVYIETVLQVTSTGPTVIVVNMHDE